MRLFKFRAFDERKKIMHNNFQFISSGNEGNDFICFNSDKEKQKANINQIVFDNPYFRKQIKVMQYTGLKDKNNKEIYEGDIVKNIDKINGNFVDEIKEVYQVVFNGCSFQYKYIESKPYTINPIGCEVEIIGNIYENPELLKKE